MKNLPEKLLSMCLLLMAGNVSYGVGMATEGRVAFRPSEWTAVSNERLDKTRGGFEMSAGLNVSFGIVRTVMINGDLVNRTSFELPDMSKITAEQARSVSAAIADSGIVQNGVGNFIDVGMKSQLAIGTVIQNTLNDQQIQTLTVINTGVNTLGLLKAMNTQSVLNDALLGSMRMR